MLSAKARLSVSLIVRDWLRDERYALRNNGGSEPWWFAELDAFAARLLVVERDGVTRDRALSAARSRRYRARKAAERARQSDAGAA